MKHNEITEGAEALCPGCESKKLSAALYQSASALLPAAKIAQIVQDTEIDPENKADDNEIKRRLEVCKECETLQGGVMCGWCGCYVQLRARIKTGYCPFPKNDKWSNKGE